jgi:hypothetical protein
VVVWPSLSVWITSQPPPGPEQLIVKPAPEAVAAPVGVLSIRAPMSKPSDYQSILQTHVGTAEICPSVLKTLTHSDDDAPAGLAQRTIVPN